MLLLPVETRNHKHDVLIVIIQPDNLARMREGDPAEVILKDIRQAGKNLLDPLILLCYEENSPVLQRLIQGGDIKAISKHLQRGWQFRPEAGDHDRGLEWLKDFN